jgi:hypothetical protein
MVVKVQAQKAGKDYILYRGDCVDVLKGVKDDSIHFTCYSPPFISLYTFSDNPRDMSNCKDDATFFAHYRFLAAELMRVTKPGRLVAVHCMMLPTSKMRDGFIGMRDFRGDLLRIHQDAGMLFHSEVAIWKNPVTAMQRSKSLRLLHKQLLKDSTMSGQGLADYLIVMRKPGDNPEPVAGPLKRYHGADAGIPKIDPSRDLAGHVADSYSVKVWQRYASPVWMDVDQSDTLARLESREHNDERHIAPLQLTVIRRCLDLWTNPGDTVLDPFAGIGSCGYVCREMGRKFVGVELKESYYKQATLNLEAAVTGQFFD